MNLKPWRIIVPVCDGVAYHIHTGEQVNDSVSSLNTADAVTVAIFVLSMSFFNFFPKMQHGFQSVKI